MPPAADDHSHMCLLLEAAVATNVNARIGPDLSFKAKSDMLPVFSFSIWKYFQTSESEQALFLIKL